MSKPQSKSNVPITQPRVKVPIKGPNKTPTRAPVKPLPVKTPVRKPSVQPNRSTAPKNPSTSLAVARPSSTTKKPSMSTKPVTSSQPPNPANWINRTVQNRIQGWGDYAGGLVNGVGDGVNRVGQGVGDAITNVTRGWGHGVAGYGNDMKDAVGVGGRRVPTGGNPLGLAGQGGARNLQATRKDSRGGRVGGK